MSFFTDKSVIDTEYFSSVTVKFFHRFSTKYSLNNNILNFLKNCVWDLPVADILKLEKRL